MIRDYGGNLLGRACRSRCAERNLGFILATARIRFRGQIDAEDRRSPCELTEPTRQCPASASIARQVIGVVKNGARKREGEREREPERGSLENVRRESDHLQRNDHRPTPRSADRLAIDINNRERRPIRTLSLSLSLVKIARVGVCRELHRKLRQ